MEHGVETEVIWRDIHDRLLSYIRPRVASFHDAEDILQEVFLRIHKNRDRLNDVQNVPAWVYRIAANAISDYYRARAKVGGALAENATASSVDAPASSQPEVIRDKGPEMTVELARCMEPLVQRLPEHYGEAVSLTDLGGLTQKEAAAQLGLSVSGMKSRVQRGRSKLKALLLDCCRVELDQRRRIVDFEQQEGDKCGDNCGCA